MARRLVLFCLPLAALATLALATTALAGNPATDQYRESVPTGSGDQSLGAKGHGHPAPLPATVVQRLDSQAPQAAPILKAVATDPAAGAPAPLKRTPKPRPPATKPPAHGAPRAARPPAADVAAPSTASALFGTRAAWLVVIGLVAAGGGYLTGRLRRRHD